MKAITILLFLVSISTTAQIKGIVKDSLTNQPIPFVNIWVENENSGTTSDEKGVFKISASEGKILVFSSVGFEVKKVTVKDGEEVVLSPISYRLKEVVISNIKNEKEIEIGEAKRIHHRQLSGDKPWIYGKLFRYDSICATYPFVKKIVFFSDSDLKTAKLKIRIFEFNDTIPTNDLLNEDLIVNVKKGMRKNIIDVSQYNLRFPEKGIVIGLEWMIIEENKFYFEYNDPKQKDLVKMESYAPSLVVNYSKEENSFNYSQGKWVRAKIFASDKKDKKWFNTVMLPAVNLILTN